MKKYAWNVVAAGLICLSTTAVAFAQTPTTPTTTTTTTVTKTVQNPDGTYTVIEYPAKKEVIVNLTPITSPNVKGVATILRDDDGTRIKLNLSNLPAEVTALTVYAVDDTGSVTPLGPVVISNGAGTLAATTPLTRFMLVASPEPAMPAYDPSTKVFFRSAAPEGFAVIPLSSEPRGEKVAAASTPGTSSAYEVPMLNIPAFKKGDDTKIKVDFTGAMTGARANVFITPQQSGPNKVKVRFHELKDAPVDQRFILWAISPDKKYQKLGQVVNAPGKNEAEIQSEVNWPDFGLLVTMEPASSTTESPGGPAVGTIHIVP
jgi:hypothetical protein